MRRSPLEHKLLTAHKNASLTPPVHPNPPKLLHSPISLFRIKLKYKSSQNIKCILLILYLTYSEIISHIFHSNEIKYAFTELISKALSQSSSPPPSLVLSHPFLIQFLRLYPLLLRFVPGPGY